MQTSLVVVLIYVIMNFFVVNRGTGVYSSYISSPTYIQQRTLDNVANIRYVVYL